MGSGENVNGRLSEVMMTADPQQVEIGWENYRANMMIEVVL